MLLLHTSHETALEYNGFKVYSTQLQLHCY